MSGNSAHFHRRSIRYKEYDYTQPGAYFLTFLTWHRECIFGKITNGNIDLYDLGNITKQLWMEIPYHFPNVEIEPYVIMPNHIHGIITIIERNRRGTIYRAPTKIRNSDSVEERFGKPVAGSIPTIIRSYKAAVSRRARKELGMVYIWQRNYFEHIIRDENEMNDILLYIQSNPINWLSDPEYTL